MEKSREKVFFRKGNGHGGREDGNSASSFNPFQVSFADSLPNVPSKNAEKEKPRPRSRSVYTSKSHNSDGSGSNREFKQYDVYPWVSRAISKNLYVEEYNVSHD